MSRFSELETFVRVVDSGSFSAAARALQITPSAVSRTIQRLESRLEVRLLDRSTRKLAPTSEGDIYYQRAQSILEQVNIAEEAVTQRKENVQGILRVDTSVPIAHHRLISLIELFCRKNPGIKIDLTCSDSLVDVAGKEVDVAIRVGSLKDSSLTARRLGTIQRKITASPDYIARCGLPTEPEQLKEHQAIRFSLHKDLNEWPIQIDGQQQRIRVDGPVAVNNGESVFAMTLAGLGLSRLADFMVDPEIAAGRLVPLLEDYNPREALPIHAVFSSRQNLPTRVRVFVDFLAEKFAQETIPGRSLYWRKLAPVT